MNRKTLEANSIPIPPHLAGRLKQALGRTGTGFDEGAFLQQLHYWTLNAATTGWVVDGVKWIYNSLKSWREQFPWMSEYGLRKAIANLKKLGLIHTAQHWITAYKRVMFYRIDYERLKTLAGEGCDLITARGANSDQLEVQPERTTETETSSNTSSSEQQTVVVSKVNESPENMNALNTQSCNPASGAEVNTPGGDLLSLASSGNNLTAQEAPFPEPIDAVAQAIEHPAGSPLPAALRRAIAQFPNQVKPAIDYLNHQQQKRQIKKPVGYLYQAIVEGWTVQVERDSILPKGFKEWFDQMKRQGLVVAAMAIDGVHHTLHTHRGWVPTAELIQEDQTCQRDLLVDSNCAN